VRIGGMMTPLKSYCARAALLAGAACFPSIGWAQTSAPQASGAAPSQPAPSPPVDAAADAQGGLQDIIVTAQRRAENVQRVPISIIAVTGDTLVKSGVTTLDGLQRVAPGLVVTTTGSGFVSYTFIRGGGTNNTDPGSDPSVAYYVDEIYLGGSAGLQFDLFDIDHVEVLKGPQGTLFGRNAASGAISVITKRPTSDLQGALHAEYGSYNALLVKGFVSGPLTADGALRYRVSGSYRRRDAFTRNLAGGGDPGNINAGGARGQLEWSKGDVDVLLSGSFLKARNGQTNQFQSTANVSGAVDPTLPQPTDQSFYAHYYDYIGYENQDMHDLNGRIEWTTPIGKITSISAYRWNRFIRAQDNDATVYFGTNQLYLFRDKTFSQELRLTGDALDRFHYVLGGYYYHADQLFHFTQNYGPAAPTVSTRGKFITDFNAYTTDSYAVFGQVKVDLIDALSLTLGGRYTHDAKADQRSVNRLGVLFNVNPNAGFSKFTPAATLEFKPSDKILAYLSYRQGFKSGGFQTVAPASAAIANTPFLPENVTSWEAGLKTTLLDNRLQLNAAIFRSDIDNQQVTRVTPATPTAPALTQIENAGKTRADGIDLMIAARPVSGLTLTANATWQRARYRRYLTNNIDLAGNHQTRSPDFTGYLAAEYETSLGNFGKLDVRGDLSRRSLTFFDAANSRVPGQFQPAYNVVNLRASVLPNGVPLEIGVFVKNLGKTQYFQNISPVGPSGTGAPGEPRVFGVSIDFHF
jgi:iron complex outermembrane receptor protein